MGTISNISGNFLQSAITKALQGTGLTNTDTTSVGGASSVGQAADTQKLSPLMKLLSTLQQLKASDPNKYQQVTQQIATNLQDAAQTATTDGTSTAAAQLSQLSTDFSNASKSGDLPDIQDLAKAIGGGHHGHHHHARAAAGTTDTDSSSSSSATSSTSAVSQLLAALQANTPQDDSQNPISIIMKTLSDAGISAAQ